MARTNWKLEYCEGDLKLTAMGEKRLLKPVEPEELKAAKDDEKPIFILKVGNALYSTEIDYQDDLRGKTIFPAELEHLCALPCERIAPLYDSPWKICPKSFGQADIWQCQFIELGFQTLGVENPALEVLKCTDFVKVPKYRSSITLNQARDILEELWTNTAFSPEIIPIKSANV